MLTVSFEINFIKKKKIKIPACKIDYKRKLANSNTRNKQITAQ